MTAVPASGVRLEWVNERLLPFDGRFLTICGHTIHYVNEGRRSRYSCSSTAIQRGPRT